jgi:hypothetical protein
MPADAVTSAGGEPLAMAQNLMEVGAAAECAISASGLLISRCAAYYGQDPGPHVQRSQERRARIDRHMQQWARLRGAPGGYGDPGPDADMVMITTVRNIGRLDGTIVSWGIRAGGQTLGPGATCSVTTRLRASATMTG